MNWLFLFIVGLSALVLYWLFNKVVSDPFFLTKSSDDYIFTKADMTYKSFSSNRRVTFPTPVKFNTRTEELYRINQSPRFNGVRVRNQADWFKIGSDTKDYQRIVSKIKNKELNTSKNPFNALLYRSVK